MQNTENSCMTKKYLFSLFASFFALGFCFADVDLTILQEDIAVEYNSGRSIGTEKSGINLYIKKKPGVQSVMLVETTRDPEGKEDNFAYRALKYNSLNGDEIRYLNGKILDSPYAKNSLISSTVDTYKNLGECFLIYIPPVLEFGYPWTRNGTVKIGKGTFVNIRTFTEKYGDYSGDFKDNPFMFDFPEPKETEIEITNTPVILIDDFNPTAAFAFEELADGGDGKITYSSSSDSLPDDLISLLDDLENEQIVDILFAIDTTGSMKDDLESLSKNWLPRFKEQTKKWGDFRIGLVFYRDYGDSYSYKSLPVKPFPFTDNLKVFEKNLASPVIHGNEGGDRPEAVFEALYAGLEYFDWREEAEKRIILIGDAEPHPKPRGVKKITQEMVLLLAKQKNVKIDTMIVPDKNR